MNLEKAIGGTVRRLRKKQRKTQAELAEDSCLDRTYLGSIERGEKSITVRYLLYISKGLGIPLVDLIREIEHDGITKIQKTSDLLFKKDKT